MHAHTGAGPLGQGLGKLFADCSRPVYISLESDGVLRAANRTEHRREDFIAVLQCLNAVFADDGRAKYRTHGTLELRVRGPIADLDAFVDLLDTEGEVLQQQPS